MDYLNLNNLLEMECIDLNINGFDIDYVNKITSFDFYKGFKPNIKNIEYQKTNIKLISLFEKNNNTIKLNSDIILKSLNNIEQWKFKSYNDHKKISDFIINEFNSKQKFDTIITFNNKYVADFSLNYIIDDLKYDNFIDDLNVFNYYQKNIYNNCINTGDIENEYIDIYERSLVYESLKKSFNDMSEYNDDEFSFRYIDPKYIHFIQSLNYDDHSEDFIIKSKLINNKNILILDNSIIYDNNDISIFSQSLINTCIVDNVTIIKMF